MRLRAGAMLAVVLAGLAVTAVGAAAAEEPQWRAVTTEDKAVTAEFPGEATYTANQLRSGQGFPYLMHQHAAEFDGRAFIVQTAVYPKDVYVNTPQANLQGGLDAAAKSMDGGKWTSIAWTRHQGLIASDAIGQRGGLEVRTMSVLKGQRIVTVTYAGPPETAKSAEVERFFKSLKIQ